MHTHHQQLNFSGKQALELRCPECDQYVQFDHVCKECGCCHASCCVCGLEIDGHADYLMDIYGDRDTADLMRRYELDREDDAIGREEWD